MTTNVIPRIKPEILERVQRGTLVSNDLDDLNLLTTKDFLTGWSLLHMAVHIGNLEMSKLLVKKDPRIMWETAWCGYTAYHMAKQSGNRQLIDLLIDTKWSKRWNPTNRRPLDHDVFPLSFLSI